MGCDIHAFIEVRENNQWKHFNWEKEFQDGEYEDGSPRYDYRKIFDHPLYIGRNYDLFAILANVRNGRGFAGIKTSEGFNPIALPRDLPYDVTPEVKEESDRWNGDGHSHSYILLSELLAYDWNGQGTTQYGVVGKEQYKEYLEKGYPTSYCGDVSGSMIRKVSNREMDDILIDEREIRQGQFSYTSDELPQIKYYTHVQWQESYKEAIGESWFKTLEELSKLGSPDDVRLVFWFDN